MAFSLILIFALNILIKVRDITIIECYNTLCLTNLNRRGKTYFIGNIKDRI